MTLRKSVWVLILVCVAIPNSAAGFSEPGQDDKTMMDAMAKAAAPGEQHKQLGALAGTWMAEVKSWMAPGQPPMTAKGSATITPILGGRYIREDFSGEFMQMPFTGMGLTGYDNIAKKYVASWVDNMGTGILRLTGTFDASANTYMYTGKQPDPVSGQEKDMRMSVHVVDKNKHVAEFFDPTPDGKWAKILEITYTRKQ